MRPLRVVYPGALYHVVARGIERRSIFLDGEDHRRFLALLGDTVVRYGWVVHGYCLMGNHFHLLVETPRANLSIGMRHLNGCYAQWFNRRRERVGPLFQGRFKAELVEKQAYLLALVRYMALNPSRTARPLCASPELYAWSSYRALLGLAPAPTWLTTDWILSQFGDDAVSGREPLRAFVERGLDDEAPRAVGGLYLGGEEFIDDVTRRLVWRPEVPRGHWQPLRPSLDEIFESEGAPILVAYRSYGYRLREIADHMGCHYQTVSRRLRATEALCDRET